MSSKDLMMLLARSKLRNMNFGKCSKHVMTHNQR
jgi:hypothetical protein